MTNFCKYEGDEQHEHFMTLVGGKCNHEQVTAILDDWDGVLGHNKLMELISEGFKFHYGQSASHPDEKPDFISCDRDAKCVFKTSQQPVSSNN